MTGRLRGTGGLGDGETGRMNLAPHSRAFLCVCLPAPQSPSPPVSFVRPNGARELAQRCGAAHLRGEERDAADAQSFKLSFERAEPALLHPCARAAEGAAPVPALDAVDDEVSDGDAFFAERLEVARALLEGQRFGDGDEDEARVRAVE